MKANAPDWWARCRPEPTGLKEDRYVSAVQIKEISSLQGSDRRPVHLPSRDSRLIDEKGNAGRDASAARTKWDATPSSSIRDAGPLMKAGSQLVFPSIHMHANAEDTTAHLRVAYKFHPKDYKPKRRTATLTFGNGEIDLRPMRPVRKSISTRRSSSTRSSPRSSLTCMPRA